MSSQLLLFPACQNESGEIEVLPDLRHSWLRRSHMPGRADEWQCKRCGELALRDLDRTWAYLSPVKGDAKWPKVSHECVQREF